MPLLTSLLTAISRADGDALVLHSGERPYVVAPSGQSELSARVLTLDAMTGMLRELLSEDLCRVLDEVGAVQHELANPTIAQGERFTVVAARGGDDIWIEIRRHRKVEPVVDRVIEPVVEPVIEPIIIEPTIEPIVEPVMQPAIPVVAPVVEPVMEPVIEAAAEPEFVIEFTQHQPPEATLELVESEPEAEAAPEPEPETYVHEISLDDMPLAPPFVAPLPPEPVVTAPPQPVVMAAPEPVVMPPPEPVVVATPPPPEAATPPPPVAVAPPPEAIVPPPPQVSAPAPRAPEPRAQWPKVPLEQPEPPAPLELLEDEAELHPAVVLPLARSHVRDQSRSEHPIPFPQPLHNAAGIDRLLRIAAARGASTLYLTSQARPSIRIDGGISPIEGEPLLSETEVEALMLDLIPERNREALRSAAGTEWICDVPDVGRIRCVTFRDHRGAGGIFRMIPARAISAEQLGLSREIQGLCAEANGLVLVTGPRSSGKSTLISAFVDLINRTRSDHVITLEHQIKFVHENRGSLVSQREVRGDNSEWMAVARAALRENPDVLVIEDLRSPEIVTLALEAAQSGHLVIGALTAHTATEAIDRIIDQTPSDRRPKIQLGLAEALRGVVAQVLLRKTGGGRVAAREVLLNTSAVANVIAEGKTSQLPMAIDSGRRHGMVALNDALVAFVKSGIVDSREAYRQAADQTGFLALLKRQGIDTSFVERLA